MTWVRQQNKTNGGIWKKVKINVNYVDYAIKYIVTIMIKELAHN